MALVGVVPKAHPERIETLLRNKAAVIALEDQLMGAQFERSILIGNFLHKTAVLSGLAFLGTSLTRIPFRALVLPFGVLSIGCAGLYDALWVRDPLSQYQLDHSGDELAHVPAVELSPSSSYVVLVHRDSGARQTLHNTIALVSLAVIAWRLFRAK